MRTRSGWGRVFVTTSLGAASGAFAAMLVTPLILKKADISMALNGVLAGLVGITASADVLSPGAAMLVGAISGVIVVGSILFFERIGIDDPVGAISVHGICGTWGTLAAGIWGEGRLLWQIVGCLAYAIVAFAISFFALQSREAGHGRAGDRRGGRRGPGYCRTRAAGLSGIHRREIRSYAAVF